MNVDEFYKALRAEINKNEGLFKEEARGIYDMDFCDWLDFYINFMCWQTDSDCDAKYYERINNG